ncbi:Cd(II)/Pb(II)-responsive transcriptional regulator [Piscinibacter koreensis]|uniref:Cd(II)/Pb(II)-responsive transcriptional regulator n=1 Tax=Piscinibacter koreensis TaxID=2742824 RepID=A0A7Y6NS27_9BURK|nr:Cd(II)/Pb(II)-responsive transcriptional regulator [Schlegelella koreensis]NUZ08296.1 Cd(II)/Pb(II)-responsive transcriptional regulator [Schlegelella koreensis]
MRIGELASRAGCDVETVRFYERDGLLEAPARDPSGYRRYDRRHLQRVQFIRHCRSLDMPLAEIRRVLGFAATPDAACGHVDELLDGHIARVRERLEALRALEAQLVALRSRCDGDASHTCAILESFQCDAALHGAACGGGAAATKRVAADDAAQSSTPRT